MSVDSRCDLFSPLRYNLTFSFYSYLCLVVYSARFLFLCIIVCLSLLNGKIGRLN